MYIRAILALLYLNAVENVCTFRIGIADRKLHYSQNKIRQHENCDICVRNAGIFLNYVCYTDNCPGPLDV